MRLGIAWLGLDMVGQIKYRASIRLDKVGSMLDWDRMYSES
jgi:hypothetical protein